MPYNKSSKVVAIFIDGSLYKILPKLNLSDKLSNIREELDNKDINNDMLLFLQEADDDFYEIEREQEVDFTLGEILKVDNGLNLLYLRFSWRVLNDKCKLDYGYTMSFDGPKKAFKKAFTMKGLKGCNFDLIGNEGYKKDRLEFMTKEDWMNKTNLYFSADVNINSVGLGIPIERLKNKNFNSEIQSIYKYTEIGKVLLKLSKENLESTDDFKKDVISAINSGNPREEFRKITEEYGQFISTEVILGGRVYFKDNRRSSENSADNSNAGPGNNSRDSKSKSKFYNFEHMKLLGGKLPDVTIFDENAWAKSLGDYRNWDCIEFKNPVSIFQLLPNDLRKGAFKSIGKRILHMSTEDCDYDLNKPGMPRIYDLDNLPQNISKIIQDEDADCDFFASVVDTEDSKDIFFNCQILRQSNGKASIIIHCVQKKFHRRKYKLKIGLMVTGYDMDFDLILSDISVELIRKNYDPQNESSEFHSISLEKSELYLRMARGNPFFGIPILSDLNNSLIIGHSFRSTQSDTEDKVDTFSYCLKRKCYVNLPKFTFCTFIIILNNSNPHAYALLPIMFNILGNPFINLEGQSGNLNAFWHFGKPLRFRNWVFRKLFERIFRKKQVQSNNFDPQFSQSSSFNPKYFSLYLSNNDDYRPIFLKQKIKRIKVKYVDCNCKKTCSICSKQTKKMSKNDNNTCVLFDPNVRV